MNKNSNQDYYADPSLVSGNPAIDNIKKMGQDKLFIIASAVYIALPILQLILNFETMIPIQLIGVVGMILIVVSCNTKAYPGVNTSGFSVLKGYSITMIVVCGLLAISCVFMLISYDELIKNEEIAEELNQMLEDLISIIGFEVSKKIVFAILIVVSAVIALRYVLVTVMCDRLKKTVLTGKNCGKIPVLLAVFYIITAFFNIVGVVGAFGSEDIFNLILVLLGIISDLSFTVMIFKYNNSLNSLWYS